MKRAIIGGSFFIGGAILLSSFAESRNLEAFAGVGLIVGLLGLVILLIESFRID